MAPNIFDSQYANNSMLPRSSVPLRPHNLRCESNQLLPFAANAQETQGSTNTILPSVSMALSLRQPQFSQLNQQLSNQDAVTHDLFNLQSANPLPLNNSLLSRTPQFSQLGQQLNNEDALTQDLFNLQSTKPLHLNNSLLSRTQQSTDDQGGLTFGQMMPNMMDTQHDNSLFLRQSSMPSRAPNFDLQGLLNQPIRPIPTYPHPGSSLQLSNQLLNSPTQEDIFGTHNSLGYTTQLKLHLNDNNEQSFLGRRNRASNIYAIGELPSPSSSSKRSKISNFMETGSTATESRENELENLLAANPFNHPRPIKNSLYDPIFESLGLPIDPHLRLFNSNH